MPIETITNQSWFEFKDEMYKKYPAIKRGTLHQYKNALRVVLNDAYQRGTIKSLPVFKDTYSTTKIDSPRPWFNFKEYRLLQDGIKRHIIHLKKTKPRWVTAAQELYDYVIFATNTGLRVSEMSNVRFCDIEVHEELAPPDEIKQFLIIRNIKGKRGTGTCKSYYGAIAAYERIKDRKKIKYPQTSKVKLFAEHHRDMFNTILEENDLKYSKTQPPARRDFVSLRATYICFRLLNQADIFEVATNCRTSPQMIRDSYAKYLGGELMPNINRTKGKIDGWDR
jgi:integrase